MEETNYRVTREGDNELKHYGVKGMKWGVRNDPKPDGRQERLRRQYIREELDRTPVRRERFGKTFDRLGQKEYMLERTMPKPTNSLITREYNKLYKDNKARAEKFIDRERRAEELERGRWKDSPIASIRDFLGEDEAITLGRAVERYNNALKNMSTAGDEYVRSVLYGKDEVIIDPKTGFLAEAVVVQYSNNPGMTEKELIEKMQQTRAAVAQAQAAFDKTPVGAIKKLAQKGKQKVRRFIADIKRKLKNRKK